MLPAGPIPTLLISDLPSTPEMIPCERRAVRDGQGIMFIAAHAEVREFLFLVDAAQRGPEHLSLWGLPVADAIGIPSVRTVLLG